MYNIGLSENKNQNSLLLVLFIVHIFIISISNYLVQFTVNIYGIHTTYGSFTFPFIFLATDLTIRIFGVDVARKTIFLAMFPALFVSYFISSYLQDPDPNLPNLFILRISFASFAAYVSGQLLDIFVFNKLRKHKSWWIAPSASAIFGFVIDTFVFFFIAFYKCDDLFLATNWISLGIVDYFTKVIIYGIFFLPIYGLLLKLILRKCLKKFEKVNFKLQTD